MLVAHILLLAGCGPKPEEPQDTVHADVVYRPMSEYVASFICSGQHTWLSADHAGYRLYFKEGSHVSKALPHLRSELEAAHRRIPEVLGADRYPHGTHRIAVDSKAEMKELMGYSIKGGAAKEHDLVFFVFNDTIRPQFKHEIFHLFAHELWGPVSHRLLDGGGATFTDGECFVADPMYAINARFLKEELLFPLHELLEDLDGKATEQDVVAYIQAAGVFQYLMTEFGRDRLKALWTAGPDAFPTIYGFSWDELEHHWLQMLEQVPVPEGLDLEHVLDQGCG